MQLCRFDPICSIAWWYEDDPAEEAGPDDVRPPGTSDGRALLAAVDPASDLLEVRLGVGGGDVDDIVLTDFWTPEQPALPGGPP